MKMKIFLGRNLIHCVGNTHHPREGGSSVGTLSEPEKSVFLTPELACLSANRNSRHAVYQSVLLAPELVCLSAVTLATLCVRMSFSRQNWLAFQLNVTLARLCVRDTNINTTVIVRTN